MSETRKIILLIVEGVSDEKAFSVLSKYNDIKNSSRPLRPKILIISTGGDKIPYEYTDASGRHYPYMKQDCINKIVDVIKGSLESELSGDCLNLSDIEKVLLVTDMDGVYIDDQNVKLRPKTDPFAGDEHPTYTESEILSDTPYSTRDRNKRKRINLEYMLNQPYIVLQAWNEKASIPFGLFYMSCNLDHVIDNKRMLKKKEKKYKAGKWADRLSKSPNADEKISDFFRNAVPENLQTYEETWKYMCKPKTLRSLSRASNCLFMLNELDKSASNECEGKND